LYHFDSFLSVQLLAIIHSRKTKNAKRCSDTIAPIYDSTTARQYKFKLLFFCLSYFVNQHSFKSISSANKTLLFDTYTIFLEGGSLCPALSIPVGFQVIDLAFNFAA